MGSNARIAMAVGLGYLLGRRKKMRTAMAFGAAIAAGRYSRDPAALLERGGELLGTSSPLGQVGGLTKPLTAAGKAAAAGVVSRGIESVGDRIKRRTDALRTDGEQAEPADLDNSDEQEQEQAPAQAQDERAEQPQPQAGRRPGRDGADADDEYDEDADAYDDDEDEPEEEPRPRPRQAPGMRRRPPQDDSDDSNGSQARRSESSDGGGAPVRRRVSKR